MWCCVFLSTTRDSYSIQRRLEKQWWDFGLNPLSLRSQITQSVPSRNQYKTFQRFTFLGHGSRTLPGKTAASLFLSFTVSVFFFPLLSCSSPIYPLLQRASNIYLFLPLSDTFVDCTICLSSRSDCGETGQHTHTHTHTRGVPACVSLCQRQREALVSWSWKSLWLVWMLSMLNQGSTADAGFGFKLLTDLLLALLVRDDSQNQRFNQLLSIFLSIWFF